jgi:Domain of unknown function (DUF4279)
VRLRQYVYFSLWSDSITPDELTARIGIEPDCIHVRGSRFPGPNPVPRHHMWEVRCDEHNMKMDAQIESVLGRIAPAQEAIREVITEHDDVSGRLKAGRFFGDEKGDAPIVTRRADGEIVDTGSIFGWGMSVEALGFLAHVGAYLDIDEYDMLDDEDDSSPETSTSS